MHAALVGKFKRDYGKIAATIFPFGFRKVPDWEMGNTYGEDVHDAAVEIFLEARALEVAEGEMEIRRAAN
jgi:hypothetical protein